MRITDLPELSAADLAENDVVAVDHDTGNGIETRKFRVSQAFVKKMDITATLADATVVRKTIYFTVPEGYTILNITIETVGWVGAVSVTNVQNTSCDLYCAAVGWEPSEPGPRNIVAHIIINRTFGR